MVRSVLALGLGYVVMLASQLVTDTTLTALVPEIMPRPGEAPEPAYFLYRLGTEFFFIGLGGYTTARLAGRSELKHALGLAALSVAAGILEVQYYPATQPLWYSVALNCLSIPSAPAGGYYRARQLEGSISGWPLPNSDKAMHADCLAAETASKEDLLSREGHMSGKRMVQGL